MSWNTATGGGDGQWDDGPTHAPGNGFDGGVGEGGGFGDGVGGARGGFSGGCFNCGEEGHAKVNCPQPAKARPCYNCGEEGHTKAECTNATVAREFTGTCRVCEQQGHRAADCPTAPPKLCNNCKEQGHSAFQCKNARKLTYDDVDVIPAEISWGEMLKASQEKDMDDFKIAFKRYVKACPDATYIQLESGFRRSKFGIYLIALEKELYPTYTNMDLQGNLDKKYNISFRFSPKPSRPKEKEGWPSSPEDNLARLADAGEAVDRGVPKCGNCEQLGHISKSCPEEKLENLDRAQVKCYNCEAVGHRVRDCPNPRPDKFACRNCKQSGHTSKECTEPRSAEGVECKKCNETGHFAKDCPQGGGGGGACHNCGEEGHRKSECTNPTKIVCRNCDEEGHTGRECSKPRDYSRVKCSNCQQMGHTKVRCTEPIVDEDAGAAGGFGGGFGTHTGQANDFSGGAVDNNYGTAQAAPESGTNAWGAAESGSSLW